MERSYLQHQSAMTNTNIKSIRGAGAILQNYCRAAKLDLTIRTIQLVVDALIDREKWKYEQLKKKYLASKKNLGVDTQVGL